MNVAFLIKTAGTVPVVKTSAYIYAVVISCTTAGQVLRIQNRETPDPKILIPPYTLEVAPTTPEKPLNPREFEWIDAPKLMEEGIAIVTTGTGEVSVWIDYATVGATS